MLERFFDGAQAGVDAGMPRRAVLKGLAGGAAGRLLALPRRRPAGAITAAEYCPTADEQAMLRLLNELRARHGRAPLRPSATLGAAARHHSRDMHERGYFSHATLGTGEGPGERAVAHGFPNLGVGENIAWDWGSPEATFRSLVDSPGHRDNMLGQGYRAVGIGRSESKWTMDLAGTFDREPTCGAPDPGPAPEPNPEPDPNPDPGPGPKPPKEEFCRKRPNHKRCRGR